MSPKKIHSPTKIQNSLFLGSRALGSQKVAEKHENTGKKHPWEHRQKASMSAKNTRKALVFANKHGRK